MDSFFSWLMHQQGRHDPTGDLARDVALDHRWPSEACELEEVLDYLGEVGAMDRACAAASAAWAEYRSTWTTVV